MVTKPFEIYLANLNPKKGHEVGKTRPVVVVHSQLIQGLLSTSIICPLTTQLNYPAHKPSNFKKAYKRSWPFSKLLTVQTGIQIQTVLLRSFLGQFVSGIGVTYNPHAWIVV